MNVLLVLATVGSVDLAGAADAFRAGVELRHDARAARPHFRQAAANFHEATQDPEAAAWLFLAEGHAWLLADDLPQAIAAYRRGLRRYPTHQPLHRALNHARDRIPSRECRRSSLGEWLLTVPVERIAGLGGLLSTALCLYMAKWMRQRVSLVSACGGVLVGAAVMGVVAGSRWQAMREYAEPFAVVRPTHGALPRSGNGIAYASRRETPLPAGCEVRVLAERGGWLQVEWLTGVGWLPESDVVRGYGGEQRTLTLSARRASGVDAVDHTPGGDSHP